MPDEIELDPSFAAELNGDITYYPTSAITAYDKVFDSKGNWIAIHEWHRSDRGCCGGFVAFDTPETRALTTEQSPKWTVESWEPLTLSPSLLCRRCGHHGFIQQGRWED